MAKSKQSAPQDKKAQLDKKPLLAGSSDYLLVGGSDAGKGAKHQPARIIPGLMIVVLILTGILIGWILDQRQDYAYESQLINALSKLTSVQQGTVQVSAAQSGIDAAVETSFISERGQRQKRISTLDYLQTDEPGKDVKLLDVFRRPYAELPISDQRAWVTIQTEEDIKALEDLGFPVSALINNSSHTPLLPFGNFNSDDASEINAQVRAAFSDATFIHADDGKLEYQASVSKQAAERIIEATANTAQPMDATVAERFYQDKDVVQLTLRVDRSRQRLVEAEMTAQIDGNDVTAIYRFDYSSVTLPENRPESISAEQFVNRYLRNLQRSR